jgi:hypothetical protein
MVGKWTGNNDFDVSAYNQGKRWYPTIEALADGALMVIGGDENGG